MRHEVSVSVGEDSSGIPAPTPKRTLVGELDARVPSPDLRAQVGLPDRSTKDRAKLSGEGVGEEVEVVFYRLVAPQEALEASVDKNVVVIMVEC